MPRDPQSKYRAIQWTYAALNSCEPAILNLLLIDVFFNGQEWAKLRRPGAEDFVRLKLKRLASWLGDKQWLEGERFTIGDLVMITVLRFLRHTDLVADFPNLAAYLKRGEARPAFQQALSDQLCRVCGQPTPARTRRSSSMTYFEGFVVPVATANKDAFRTHAAEFAEIVRHFGVPGRSKRGRTTFSTAKRPIFTARLMPRTMRRSSFPGSNIRRRRRGMRRTSGSRMIPA